MKRRGSSDFQTAKRPRYTGKGVWDLLTMRDLSSLLLPYLTREDVLKLRDAHPRIAARLIVKPLALEDVLRLLEQRGIHRRPACLKEWDGPEYGKVERRFTMARSTYIERNPRFLHMNLDPRPILLQQFSTGFLVLRLRPVSEYNVKFQLDEKAGSLAIRGPFAAKWSMLEKLVTHILSDKQDSSRLSGSFAKLR